MSACIGPAWLATGLLLGCPGAAWAGFGAVGPTVPVDQDVPIDPLLMWRATRPARGTVSLGGFFESLADPLVRTDVNSITGEEQRIATLAAVRGVRLGGRVALSDRVEVAASLPMWLAISSDVESDGGGPAMGDLELTAPIGLAEGPAGSTHLAVGVAPWLRLPTGNAARYVGDRGPGVGAQIIGEMRAGPVLAMVWVGADYRGFESESNVLSGPGLLGGGSIGFSIDERFAVHVGTRTDGRLRSAVVDDSGFPVRPWGSELVLSGRGSLVGGWYASGGLGLGIHAGPGAARSRLWAGVGHTWGVAAPVVEAAPVEPTDVTPPVEVATALVGVQVQDTEGVPLAASISVIGSEDRAAAGVDGLAEMALAPGTWTFVVEHPGYGSQRRSVVVGESGSAETVGFILSRSLGDNAILVRARGADGLPVRNVSIVVDGRPVGRTGSGGDIWVGGLAEAPVEVDARADTFRELSQAVTPSSSGEPAELLLQRERGAVQVVVRGPQREPVGDASVRFVGASRLGPFKVGETGDRTFVLRPGQWQVLVSSPVHGLQQRVLNIPDRDAALQVVEVVLQPPEQGTTDFTLRVVDADNRPVPDAQIALDQVDYGRTSTGGELVIEGLREGPRTIQIGGDFLRDKESPVLLVGGLQESTVLVDWKEGSTLVLARSPTGLVADATARFDGPEEQPPAPLGEDGLHLLILRPGLWQVLVNSPTWGFQQQGVAVAEESRTLHIVDTVLNPGEAGVGRLSVSVRGPEGRPVRGAQISLDGSELGTTSTSGTLSLVELATGERTLEVRHTPYAPAKLVVNVGTAQKVAEVPLSWGVGAVRVSVSSEGAPVTDATLRLGGSTFVPATPVDGTGRRLFSLEPGPWQVLANSPRFAPEQRQLTVPDTAGLTEIDVGLRPMAVDGAELLVRIQDPDGRPVPGAAVQVDAVDPINAGGGGLLVLSAVEPGRHRFSVTAPHFATAVFESLEVPTGVSERILPLTWVAVPVRVTVRGPSGTVADAEVRFEGPVDRDAVVAGSDGTVRTSLRPGSWTVLANSTELGAKAVALTIEPGSDGYDVVLDLRAAQVQVSGSAVSIKDTIYFEVGKAALQSSAFSILDEAAAVLRSHPELVRVEVEGHTDPTGGVAYNLDLSRRRAESVVLGLIARGVAPERLKARGYGPTRPVADNATDAGRAANRRVQFRTEAVE